MDGKNITPQIESFAREIKKEIEKIHSHYVEKDGHPIYQNALRAMRWESVIALGKIYKAYTGRIMDISPEETVSEPRIVYCRECMHGQQVGELGVLCEYGCEEYRPFDHFCGWGERRTFNENHEE